VIVACVVIESAGEITAIARPTTPGGTTATCVRVLRHHLRVGAQPVEQQRGSLVVERVARIGGRAIGCRFVGGLEDAKLAATYCATMAEAEIQPAATTAAK